MKVINTIVNDQYTLVRHRPNGLKTPAKYNLEYAIKNRAGQRLLTFEQNRITNELLNVTPSKELTQYAGQLGWTIDMYIQHLTYCERVGVSINKQEDKLNHRNLIYVEYFEETGHKVKVKGFKDSREITPENLQTLLEELVPQTAREYPIDIYEKQPGGHLAMFTLTLPQTV